MSGCRMRKFQPDGHLLCYSSSAMSSVIDGFIHAYRAMLNPRMSW